MKKEPIWTKSFISLFLTNLSIFIIFYGLVSTLPLYAKDVLSRTDKDAGLLMTSFLLSAIIVRPFTGRIFDEKGPQFVLIPGFITFVIGLVLLAFMDSAVVFLISAAFIGFGYGSIVPSLQTLAMQSTTPQRSGYATATFFTLFDAGNARCCSINGKILVSYSFRIRGFFDYLFSCLMTLKFPVLCAIRFLSSS